MIISDATLDNGRVMVQVDQAWLTLIESTSWYKVAYFDPKELVGETPSEAYDYVWEFYVECPLSIQA